MTGQGVYESPEGFLTMKEASELLGVSLVTFRKIVSRSRTKIYSDQLDARVKLLKAEDVEALNRPVPAEIDGL